MRGLRSSGLTVRTPLKLCYFSGDASIAPIIPLPWKQLATLREVLAYDRRS